jgi:uncharacterized protein (TIGR02145 family)
MRKIITKAIALLIAFSTVTLAQEKGSFTDARDKKKYKTVKIGEQVWMAENLNYADKNSYCYENKPANCTQYGRLYNWETSLKACPAGWHLPRKAEWEKLLNFADSTGKEAGKRLKAKSGWKNDKGKPANGTDNFGFSALLSGWGSFDARFSYLGKSGWWSTTEVEGNPKGTMNGTLAYVNEYDNAGLGGVGKSELRSIRCIQGDEEELAKAEAEAIAKEKAEAEAYVKANGGTFTDPRDKKTYKTIKINEQVWLAENLSFNATDSKCNDDKPENCTKYGRQYEWETAMKACPKGWHLPNNAEWDKLYRSADGTSGTESPYTSKTAGKYLKAADGWNGTDKFGFSALPGGGFQVSADWWSSSESSGNYANLRIIGNNSESASSKTQSKKLPCSVRCIKD